MSASPLGEMFPRTEQRDKDYYRWIGSVGGTNVKDRYGVEYCSRIGQKGEPQAKRSMATRMIGLWASEEPWSGVTRDETG